MPSSYLDVCAIVVTFHPDAELPGASQASWARWEL